MNYLEFPDNGQTVAGTTYLISQDHVINGNIILEANITLYFITGKLIGIGVLTGNYTNIQAPISQIFGENLTVDGRWTIDRAYPQWFGAKTITTVHDLYYPSYDSSDAINKAIKMKRTGEVFIPRGEYMVRKTIFVNYGINLVGESGRPSSNVADDTEVPQATILKPMRESEDKGKNDYTAGYFMMVNVKNPNNSITPQNAEWEVNNPDPITKINSIYFSNVSTGVTGLKGILVAGGFVFDSLIWGGFRQAVATAQGLYNDLKQITNCSFISGDEGIDENYIFDLTGLGDGLLFEHNATHDFRYKVLKLSGCFGGSVTANILNGDIKFDSCKAIKFSGNHCEGDPQIHLMASSVSLDNNYIEKGKRPSILLERGAFNEMPVVELNNNLFLFYDYDRSEGEGAYSKEVSEICEYDIAMKGDAILNINNSYRYWIGTEGANKLYPYGISVCEPVLDGSGTITGYIPIEKFNRYSPFLTTSSIIMPDTVIVNDVYMNDLNSQYIYMEGLNVNSKWYYETGIGHSYLYQYSIIWDYDRKILKNVSNGTSYQSVFDLNVIPILIEDDSRCVLMVLNGAKYLNRSVMLRLYRKDVTVNKTMYMDIPLCGTLFLYDNGISICGYKWKELTVEDEVMFTSVNYGINSIKYNGDIVECRSDRYPTKGKWKKGDVVYNTGTQSSESMWVFKADTDLG